MAKKYKKISSGFIAEKDGVTLKYVIEPYDIGFYIYIYRDNKLEDLTTRFTIAKTQSFVSRAKSYLKKLGHWTIEELPTIRVKDITYKDIL